jgi:fibronectin-binding autotransporter adhesin
MKNKGFGPVGSLLLSVFAFVALFGANALAATKTWTGAVDTSFSTAGNWSPSGAPVNGDDLVFDNTGLTGAQLNPNNDMVGLSISQITFQGTDTEDFIVDGNSFTLTGNIMTASVSFAEIDNPIVLGTNVQVFSGGNIDLTGAISGSNSLSNVGTGALFLDGNNAAFTGNLIVSSGIVYAVPAALGTAAGSTTIADGAQLILDITSLNSDVTIAEPIVAAGDFDGLPYTNYALGVFDTYPYAHSVTLSGPVTLTADTTVFPAFQLNLTGALSGAFKLSVAQGQEGKLAIQSSSNTSQTANGTYEAPKVTTTLSDSQPGLPMSIGFNETVIINGERQDIYVGKGGTLKGTGTVATTVVDKGGTIAPGLSPGCLNTGDLTVLGSFEAEIGGTTACTGYDQIKVTGAVDVTNGTLNTSLYNGFKPAAGQTYTIISNDGADAVTGTFTGLAEGATFNLNGNVFKISYKGGDGNDVTLTVVSVPATPNTGFQTIGNPLVTMGITSIAAVSLLGLGRRHAKATTRR